MLDVGDPLVHLPQHVLEMRAVARDAAAGDPLARYAFDRVIQRWESRVSRLGQGRDGGPGAYTLRSSTQQLIEELREARADQVDRIVDRWVLDRARYQARQIARHETVEAYRDAYEEQAASNPAVKGFRWALSPQHPRPDICDLYANQNLHGLGPGGYPPDAVPDTPHPNCLCTRVAIVDRFHSRRELARLNGEPEPPREWEVGGHETAAEWLAKQPPEFQRQLLGPTRHEVFRREPERVLTPGGAPIPVHQVLGLPAPARSLGPAVSVRGLVQADRASMAQPFPRAPRLRRGDDGRGAPPPAPPGGGPRTDAGRAIGVRPASASEFHSAFSEAMRASPLRAFVTHYTAEELSGMRALMLDATGRAGIAVKDHGDGRVEGTALFNSGGPRGAGGILLEEAVVQHGVNYLECYSAGPTEGLEALYSRHGFITVSRTPFAEEYASPDWDYAAHGRPDYIQMRRRQE